jgi:hypothetical protein
VSKGAGVQKCRVQRRQELGFQDVDVDVQYIHVRMLQDLAHDVKGGSARCRI